MIIVTSPALPGDAAGLARVQVDSYRTAYQGILPDDYLAAFSYAEQESDWRDLLTSEGRKGQLIVVARLGDLVIGYVLGRAYPATEDRGSEGEVVALHVRSEHQKSRAGRLLIGAMARGLAQKGCESLMLWVLEQNQPARGFYEHLGGVLAGRKPTQFEGVYEVRYRWPDISALTHDCFEFGPLL